MSEHTPGPWLLATSNSWRRILGPRGESVCEPITQIDRHPDLYFRNGGEDGPDAHLIVAAPDLLAAAKLSRPWVQRQFDSMYGPDTVICSADTELIAEINELHAALLALDKAIEKALGGKP